jgi:hypothetical protein
MFVVFFLVVVGGLEHAPVDSSIFRIRFDGLRVNCNSFEVIFFLEERIALLPQRRRRDRCWSCLHCSHSYKAHEKNETRKQRSAETTLWETESSWMNFFPMQQPHYEPKIHALVDELTSF